MKKKIIISIFASACIAMSSAAASAKEINNAVICYHEVTNSPFNLSEYRIARWELESDLAYFASHGNTTLKPSEMYTANKPNAVVLTFDDGYEDFYNVVFPLLKEYNAKAAVYVIGSRIDKSGYLKSWQIREMDQSGLVEIGNHTNIIHFYPYYSWDYESNWTLVNDFIEDVKECNNKIYSILGHGTESLAYPSGQYTDAMDEILKTNLGYTTTFTTKFGIVKYTSSIASPMKRIYHEHGVSTAELVQRINRFK